jgi:hypothetical protein
MRNYDSTILTNQSAYLATDSADYSTIIQYDPAISQDPPPGMAQ